jgi:hypothetical protein
MVTALREVYRYCMRLRPLLGVVLVGLLCSACTQPAHRGHPAAAATYSLWSSGLTRGQSVSAALAVGTLQIALTAKGACAWLGAADDVRPVEWPAGYRVRLTPPALIDDRGRVVAVAGQKLSLGGGYGPLTTDSSPCGTSGQPIWFAGFVE